MTQAQKIINKFGGADALARSLEASGFEGDRSKIYRWTYPHSRGGTGGMIPISAIPLVILAARNEGILLTEEDLDPRPSLNTFFAKNEDKGSEVKSC